MTRIEERLCQAEAAGKEMANALERLNWTHPSISDYPTDRLTAYADNALRKWERYEFDTFDRPAVDADRLCPLLCFQEEA
jgi:hypothetical protein